jgi:hypothetical protein
VLQREDVPGRAVRHRLLAAHATDSYPTVMPGWAVAYGLTLLAT